MSELFFCPHCRTHLAMSVADVDRQLHCPVCTGPLTPAVGTGLPAASPATPEFSLRLPPWQTVSRYAPTAGFAGVLGVVGLAALVFGAGLPPARLPVAQLPKPVAVALTPTPVAIETPAVAPKIAPPTEEPIVRLTPPPVPVDAGETEAAEKPTADPVAAPKGIAREVARGAAKDQGIVLRQRNRLSDEELRKQLIKMPEVALDRAGDGLRNATLLTLAARNKEHPLTHPLMALLNNRPDLSTLPMRMGDECQLGKEPAENLHAQSRTLRSVFSEVSNPAALAARRGGKAAIAVGVPADDVRMDAQALRESFATRVELKEDFHSTAGIPALMQMLTPESSSVRKVLVEQLANVEHSESTAALVKIALYDTNDEVRAKAVQALAQRSRDDYRAALLDGFRYPWAPVADHAAETLVALNDRAAVPELERLATLPDPSAPHFDEHHHLVVREVVRVNHMRNCLMCHAPSASTNDLLRARVPEPGKPVPPPFSVAYYNADGSRGDATKVQWVRADVTYLRQDFSIPQPVEKADPWPSMQRYDYLVRTRPVAVQDAEQRAAKKNETYPQRDAVLYALRELSH